LITKSSVVVDTRNDTKRGECEAQFPEVVENMVGPNGLEPLTSTVSRWRSSQLSYGPTDWSQS
jgi:hypothetical protein